MILQMTLIKNKKRFFVWFFSGFIGFFYINPYLSLSLAITLFSFAGVPPLIGFFAKQMVLSAALDKGYIFMALVGILTSVISAVYYLNVIKNLFFFKDSYEINPHLEDLNMIGHIEDSNLRNSKLKHSPENIVLSSALSNVISILTLILLLFIYIPNEWFSIANILTLILFKP